MGAQCLRAIGVLLLLAALLPAPVRAEDTLYGKLGGQPGVARIVEGAVTLFFADPRLRDDFDNIAPARLKTRLADFICQVSGGPCQYRGRSIAASHAALQINRARFNAVAENLQTAMEQAGVPYWTQNRLLALLAPLQRDIVTQ